MPLVEKEYRVLKDVNHRAIAGYSMGGSQSLSIGLTHPELFAYVGAFSFPFASDSTAPAFFQDPAKANKDFKLLWTGCGDDDEQATNTVRSFHKLFPRVRLYQPWDEAKRGTVRGRSRAPQRRPPPASTKPSDERVQRACSPG